MNRNISIAPVRKTVTVEASPARAFEVFTLGIDRWWPKTHGTGSAPIRTSIIEPFVGGRWYNELTDDSEVTVGQVRAWEPGRRFVVGWEITAQWKPEARTALTSEVEVRFSPDTDGHTRVEIEHRDFERMEEGGAAMRAAVDNGWPGILELFAQGLAGAGARAP